MRRLTIETEDSDREINRWEVLHLGELIPDWGQLTPTERIDRLAELSGEGAEVCKTLEADSVERHLLRFEVGRAAELPDRRSCTPLAPHCFPAALEAFKRAAMRLDQSWGPEQQVEGYPAYLPDFSELALDVQAIERS